MSLRWLLEEIIAAIYSDEALLTRHWDWVTVPL
jgi:hypothetical protein